MFAANRKFIMDGFKSVSYGIVKHIAISFKNCECSETDTQILTYVSI